ncbi:MAG: CBS domain-containing protein [Bacteroidia bacterium]|nr:CBS domain-containing protein [Bacteroidia bacterium]
MIVSELISDYVPSVTSGDSATRALNWMNEFKLSQLPVVDDRKFQGLITENDLLDADNLEASVGEIKFSGWDSAFIYEGNHVYDALDLMFNLKLEVLPVLDEESMYLGVITFRELAPYLGRLFAVHQPGGILVLEIPKNGYSLSEIGRITESGDAKVLSLYLWAHPEGHVVWVTLKLNVEDLSRVVAAFERFDYTVVRIYHKVEPLDDYRRNIDALMNYLNM